MKDVKGVKEVKSNQFEKRLEVHYLESQSPLSKLAHAIAAVEPLHGESYIGVLALRVEGLTPENLSKAQEALAKIKGVNKPVLDTKGKDRLLTVTFNNKAEVKLPQFLDALKAAGFKAEAYVVATK